VITARIIMDGYLRGHGGGAEARPVNFARAVVLGKIWHRVDTAVDSASLHGPLSDANVAAANNKGWWIIYLVGQWLQRRHQVPEEGAESLELRGTYC
jgi:hypothetical protein